MAKLTWLGQRILDRVEAAEKAAIDEVMDGCAKEASSGWPRGESGLSARYVRIRKHARRQRNRVYGTWGRATLPRSNKYSASSRMRVFFIEVGFRGRPGLGLLRKAADHHYPKLRERIAYHFARGRR